jgi:hypothetical protein
VRTCYEIEETDAYLAARELLLRRFGAWADANGLAHGGSLAPLVQASARNGSPR